MIQTGSVLKFGTAPSKNDVGAWAVVIPSVDVTSKWCQYYLNPRDVLPGSYVGSSVQLELGVGEPGSEIRRWKSLNHVLGGSELEFDDSYMSSYVPFNFRALEIVSVRIARLGSVSMNMDFFLQLYS